MAAGGSFGGEKDYVNQIEPSCSPANFAWFSIPSKHPGSILPPLSGALADKPAASPSALHRFVESNDNRHHEHESLQSQQRRLISSQIQTGSGNRCLEYRL